MKKGTFSSGGTEFDYDPPELIGYARVSTQNQNLELRTEALTKACCKRVFEDKISGTRAERPGLTKAQKSLREGDTLVVWKLDRLGRSVKHLVPASPKTWSADFTRRECNSEASPTRSTPDLLGMLLLSCDGQSCRNGT